MATKTKVPRRPLQPKRCSWAASGGPEGIKYHDTLWGVPVHDDRTLFEFLVLEGAQAGLSWWTIWRKRDAYFKAFAGFDVERIANFDQRRVERILKDCSIVRNRLKVQSVVRNARAALDVRRQSGSLDGFLWQFVGYRPIQHRLGSKSSVPSESPESVALSSALRKAGFSFVGATICYAFMQAVGMVNDHLTDCFRWTEVRRLDPEQRVNVYGLDQE